MLPRNLRPIRLSRRSEPFDSDEFIYELKIDGFRSLAHLQAGCGELVSRNGNTLRGFAEPADWLALHIKVENAVLDGVIACVDDSGQCSRISFPQTAMVFIAFDLLYLDGKDLRVLPLLERKAMLQ